MYAGFALLTGLVFGIGLLVSGMVDPANVLGFLDLAGRWNPSLLFVMAGAVAVAGVGLRMASARTRTLLATPILLPQPGSIDRRLVGGATLFGIGWGLAGFCPGPALVALGSGQRQAIVFVLAMLAGMLAFEGAERLRARHTLRRSTPNAGVLSE